MLPLVQWIRDKKGPILLYELNGAGDFLHLEDVLQQASELPRAPLLLTNSTRTDLHHVVKQLGEKKTQVLMPAPLGTLPYTSTRYNLAGELMLAGCPVSLMPTRDAESALQEFRVTLAELVRTGMPRDEVLKSVTLRPAELLGIADRFGSIEQGKEADFVFWEGHPLDPHSQPRRVVVAGEVVWEAK